MEAVIKLTRENLKRELALFQISLQKQFNRESLMRMVDQGETRHRIASTFLEKIGARADKASNLGRLLGDLIRRNELVPYELETLLTVIVVDATFHGAIDGALAALEESADEGQLQSWIALDAVERLLDSKIVRARDICEKLRESQSKLVSMLGLPV